MSDKGTKLLIFVIHQLIASQSQNDKQMLMINEFFLKEFVQGKILSIFAESSDERMTSILNEVQTNRVLKGSPVKREKIQKTINEIIENVWKN